MASPDPTPPEKSLTDSVITVFFIIGLVALSFIGGGLVEYFHLPPASLVDNGLEAAGAWYERWGETGIFVEKKIPVAEGLRNSRVTGDVSRAYEGYTLLTLFTGSKVYLVDMKGAVVHIWDVPFSKIWPHPPHVAHPVGDSRIEVERAELFPNGDIIAVYGGRSDTPYGYGMVKVDKDSHVIWTYDQNAHHDFYIDREGDIYTLTQQIIDTPSPGLEDLQYPALTDYISRLTPDGKEIYRFSVIDAFRHSEFAGMLHYPVSHKPWDHLHTNSIMKIEPGQAGRFPMFKAGQILISIRNMNALAVIDPDTQKVVWAHQDAWKAQHAARVLDNGHFLIFDNRGLGERSSRIVEFDPATSQIIWSFGEQDHQSFFSDVRGGLQRLPNGNTLIAETEMARAVEVTQDGTIAWSYALPKKAYNGILTAYRYPKDSLTFLSQGKP